VNVVPLREALNFAYDILRISFGVVLAGNMFVLLIVCANISSLLWARSLARAREMAVRSALGASRWRLMRQLLVESTVLAALGGAAGILVAAWALGLLRATMPDDLYRVGAVSLDGAALAVTLVVSFATALTFGLAPAWRLTRADLTQSIKDGTANAFGRSSVQAVLVAGQIALSVMLLVGTGLMLRSFQALRQVNPGFTADRVLSMKLALPSSRYAGREAAARFHRNLLEEAKAVPGVTRAATVNFLPLNHEQAEQEFAVIGPEQASGGKKPTAVVLSVSAGYFEAMGIPVTRGRPFSERDDLSAPSVVVINRTMANQYWRDTDPIGRPLIIGGQVERYAVVGVVGDTSQSNLTEPPGPQMYVSQLQRPSTYFRLIARTLGEPRAIAKEGAVWRVDRDLPVTEIRPLTEVVSEYLLPQRTVSALLAFMGVGALLLAVIGIYGLMAFFVARRRKEIAIRMALGARRADVLGLVLRRGLTLATAGVVVGLAGSVGVVQAMKSLIFGVGTLDPVAFGGIPLVLIGVASLASWLPARRASRVDPMAALRQE
jgi:putative ABC transport system permease protein